MPPLAVALLAASLFLPPEATSDLVAVQRAFSATGTGWSLERIQLRGGVVTLRFVGEDAQFDATLQPPDDGQAPWYRVACEAPGCADVLPRLEPLLAQTITDNPWLDSSAPRPARRPRPTPNRDPPLPAVPAWRLRPVTVLAAALPLALFLFALRKRD